MKPETEMLLDPGFSPVRGDPCLLDKLLGSLELAFYSLEKVTAGYPMEAGGKNV